MNESDIIGKKFGKLTVLSLSHKKQLYKNGNKDGNSLYYYCKCDCGNNKIVLKSRLKNGKTKSCGCLRKETSVLNGKKGAKKTGDKLRKYNKKEKVISAIFNSMKQRCYNKNCSAYKNYGGRGIKICDKWLNNKNGIKNFINWAINNGYQEGLTIDRINNNGDYCPENCRWITMKEQNKNKRSNVIIKINNEEKCISEWAEIYNLNDATVRRRFKVGDKNERLIRKIDLLKRKYIIKGE